MILIGLSFPAHNFSVFPCASHTCSNLQQSRVVFFDKCQEWFLVATDHRFVARKRRRYIRQKKLSKLSVHCWEQIIHSQVRTASTQIIIRCLLLRFINLCVNFCIFTVLGPEFRLKVNYQHCFDVDPLAKCLGSVCIIIELGDGKFSCLMRPPITWLPAFMIEFGYCDWFANWLYSSFLLNYGIFVRDMVLGYRKNDIF